MERHLSYFNLLDALKEDGCCICSLLKKIIHKLMEDFLYEQVNDPGVRSQLRKSLGFCSLHAWQLQKFGDPLGQAIIYEDLIQMVIERMEKIMRSEKGIKDFSAEISKIDNENYQRKKSTCPLCKSKTEAEARYISTFIESFKEPEFLPRYKSSFGLCLPHLGMVINTCREKKMIREILNIELAKIKKLISELKEIQRKHDYRFSSEGFGEEGDAWIRAVEKMVGKEGIL